jgi:hypothetical protein
MFFLCRFTGKPAGKKVEDALFICYSIAGMAVPIVWLAHFPSMYIYKLKECVPSGFVLAGHRKVYDGKQVRHWNRDT